MADGVQISPEGDIQSSVSVEVHEIEQPKNLLEELHKVLKEVADRVDQRLVANPQDLWAGTDKRYRLPRTTWELQRFEEDIRAGFPNRRQETHTYHDENDEVKDATWTVAPNSGHALLEVGERGEVVGVQQFHLVSALENSDSEFIAHQLGALQPNETIDSLK